MPVQINSLHHRPFCFESGGSIRLWKDYGLLLIGQSVVLYRFFSVIVVSSRRKISVTVQFAPFVKPYCVLIAADAAVLLISGRLDHIAVTNKLRCFAVDRFRADARKHSEFAGKGADDIVRGVYGDTDNMDSFFFVWQSHSSDYIFSVVA